MLYTRRHLIKGGATLAAFSAIPRPLFAWFGPRPEPVPPIEDPRIKQLADISNDTAASAGASYADVRLMHSYGLKFGGFPAETEYMTFGVRVLVDGYWGFASSPIWSPNEAARLARAAVENAKVNTAGKARTVDLAPISPMTSGHWTTPVKDDPFNIDRHEIEDFLNALRGFIYSIPDASPNTISAEFGKQDRAFASTLGQYCTQRLYDASGAIGFLVNGERQGQQVIQSVSVETVTNASAGFEYLRDQPIEEEILRLVEETKADFKLPVKPVDVGRYDIVLSARAVASLMSETIGAATELDRALGYEANAGGTSYIDDPLAMVDTLQIAAPSVTITADRTQPAGMATVKWDDEGVAATEFPLVQQGMLVNMQTDREGAGWFAPVFAKRQQPVRSYGCSYTPLATIPPMSHCANLVLQPSNTSDTFDSMVEKMPKGIAFKHASIDLDFQKISGFGTGMGFEVKDGKRVALLAGAGFLFRTPELWKSVTAIGGPASARQYGLSAYKGQPMRASSHSVTSTPLTFKETTIIDSTRKA